MTTYDLLPKIAIITIVVGCSVPMISRFSYNRTYSRAESYAIQQFGNKQFPLTETERQEWYSKMEVEKDKQPTKEDLNKFLDGKVK